MAMNKPNSSWLLKTEPTSYSIDDLKRDKITDWTGIRNYQARNFMTKDMAKGDMVLFYHSSCEVPGVYGVAKIASGPLPDPTQFDPKDSHFDPKATKTKPIWFMVKLSFVKKLKNPVSLYQIKASSTLSKMVVAKQGSRLSIQPVSRQHFDEIVKGR
jgi:predicted RNA-binding protein with PUA-like domain